MKRALVLLALAGCATEETDALMHRQVVAEQMLAERQAVAQNLNEYRKEMDRLEEALATADAQLARPDRVELLGLFPGATRFEPKGQDEYAVAGAGGAASALRAWARLETRTIEAVVKELRVGPKEWSLTFFLVPRYDPKLFAPSKSGPAAPPPLPPRGMFSGSANDRRRAQIAETEKRIAELDRVLGEMSQIRRRKEEVERKLKYLEAIKDSNRGRAIAERLFGGETPLLSSGRMVIDVQQIELHELPSTGGAVMAELAKLGELTSEGGVVKLRLK